MTRPEPGQKTRYRQLNRSGARPPGRHRLFSIGICAVRLSATASSTRGTACGGQTFNQCCRRLQMDCRNVVLKVEVYPNGGAVISYRDKYGEHPGSAFPSFGALNGRWVGLPPCPYHYAVTTLRRMDFGLPAANIWFKTATPMAASVCCVARLRARRRGPISTL